jgi:hypothetical protein
METFGRVPMFYYLVHLPLLHGAAVLFSFVKYHGAAWLRQDLMATIRFGAPVATGIRPARGLRSVDRKLGASLSALPVIRRR